MANDEVCRELTLFSKRPTILHLPTKGRDLLQHQSHLLGLHKMGIRNLFVVMGDPSKTPEDNTFFQQSPLDSVDLVRLIKEKFNQGFNDLDEPIGEPTNFVVGCAVNLTPRNSGQSKPEPAFQMERLHHKLRAGADFLITQPIFDVEKAASFLREYEQLYGPIPIPIFPGIVPFGNVKQLHAFSKIPGITIPSSLMHKLSNLDPASFLQECLKFTRDSIAHLKLAHPKIQGIYFVSSFSSLPSLRSLLSI